MKTLITKSILCLLFLLPFAGLQAQDCETYYPFQEGVTFEITSYDGKDKVTGKSRHNIKELNGNQALVEVVNFDKKDKEQFRGEYDLACSDGQFKLDMRSMMGPDNMGSMEGMDVNIDASDMTFPANPVEGDELPDAHLKVSMQTSGMSIGGVKINIVNRKVAGTETITTPAGTFDCTILTQNVETKTMGMKIRSSTKTWYAKGAGPVKTESYKANGKLMGKEIMTALNR